MQDFNQNPIFSKAEVQQLRKLLSEQIQRLENRASFDKEDAKLWKHVDSEYSNAYWKEHFKTRAKIKKLAKLQVKMKAFDELY